MQGILAHGDLFGEGTEDSLVLVRMDFETSFQFKKSGRLKGRSFTGRSPRLVMVWRKVGSWSLDSTAQSIFLDVYSRKIKLVLIKSEVDRLTSSVINLDDELTE